MDLDVEVLCALGVVIGRVFDLNADLLELLLLLLEGYVLLLYVLDLMRVLLQDSLQVLYAVLGLLIHGLILLYVQVVFLHFRLHFLLCSSEVVLHLLLCVVHLFLKLLAFEQLVLV